MSWRGSGNFRSSGSSPRRTSGGARGGSVFDGGSAGGPPLITLIIACGVIGVVGLALALAGVRIGGTSAPVAGAPTAIPAPTAAPTAAPAAAAPTAAAPAAPAGIPTEPLGPALASGTGEALTISSDGDQLKFAPVSLTASANTVYSLTFSNTATAVQHNWVLVSGDVSVADAVNNAAQAQVAATRNAAGAVPPADTAGLLVSTQMLNAGESVTVSFTTPGPGTYKFLCTFPGHYLAGMQGDLVVN